MVGEREGRRETNGRRKGEKGGMEERRKRRRGRGKEGKSMTIHRPSLGVTLHRRSDESVHYDEKIFRI
jgi:hypothetical protein